MRHKKKGALLLAGLMMPFTSSPASADYTGKQLVRMCDQTHLPNVGPAQTPAEKAAARQLCITYLAALYSIGLKDGKIAGIRVCPERYLGHERVSAIVQLYLIRHRARLNEPASRLVAQAFRAEFPCKD